MKEHYLEIDLDSYAIAMPFGVAVVFNVLMVLVVDTTSEVLKKWTVVNFKRNKQFDENATALLPSFSFITDGRVVSSARYK